MDNEYKLRGQALGLTSMLGIQFILGMILNLFVHLPTIHSGTTGNYVTRSVHSFGWAITNGGGIVLILHVIVAIGLLLGSINLMIRSIYTNSARWITLSVLGVIGVLAALTNGLAFLDYSKDVSSFIMSLGFLLAVTVYSMAVSYAPRHVLSESTEKARSSGRVHGKFRTRASQG